MGHNAEAQFLGDLGSLLVSANAKPVMEFVESLRTEPDKMLLQVSQLTWCGAPTCAGEADFSPHPQQSPCLTLNRFKSGV